MGFLSGVLGAVKDDPSVTTYYTKMDETLQTIKSSMHTPGGLSAAVTAVSDALGEWDREVTERTSALRNRLNTIQNEYFDNFNSSLNYLKYCKPEQVTAMLHRCIRNAEKLPDAVKNAEAAYFVLDPELQKKLRDNVQRVELEVEKFAAAAKNNELKAVVNTAKDELNNMQTAVNNRAEELVRVMQNKISSDFDVQIRIPIENVNEKLTETKKQLSAWIGTATEVMNKAINKCDEILKGVNKDHKDNKKGQSGPLILQRAETLKEKAHKLRKAAIAARNTVQKKVEKALADVLMLDRTVKDGLEQVKVQLLSGIDKYVRGYVDEVQKLIKKIKGGDTDNNEGLKDVVNAVKEWATEFTKDDGGDGGKTFGDKVADWLTEILKHDEFVRGLLLKYVTSLRGDKDKLLGKWDDEKTEFNEDGILQIVQTIKKQLTDEFIDISATMVQQQIQQEDDALTKTIDDYVSAVQVGCGNFSTKLGQKLKNDSNDSFVKAIANEVEVALRSDLRSTDNLQLKYAIKYILIELVVAAKQIGAELYSFATNDSMMSTNIHAALEVTKTLEKAFHDALLTKSLHDGDAYEATKAYTSGKVKLTDNIQKTISEALDKQIGTEHGGGLKEKFELSNHFGGYKKQLDASNVSTRGGKLTGTADANEGTFPQAVKNIETESLKELNANGVETMLNERDATFTSAFEDIQNELAALTKLVNKRDENKFNSTDNKGAQTLLKELKDMLGENSENPYNLTSGLTKIRNDVTLILGTGIEEKYDYNLKTIVEKAKKFYDKVMQKWAHETITNLKAYVEEQVRVKTTNIQGKAQQEYYTKIKEMFTVMDSRVTANITTINEKIDESLQSGVKGLISKMKNEINPIKEANNVKTLTGLSAKAYSLFKCIAIYARADLQKLDNNFNQLENFEKHIENFASALNLHAHFSHPVSLRLSTLSSLSSALDPQALPDAGRPVLRALRDGMLGFVGELGKGYVSRYDGGETVDMINLVTFKDGKLDGLTDNGRNLSKVFLTTLETLMENFAELRQACKTGGKRYENRIRLYDETSRKEKIKNHLGHWFKGRGFRVSEFDKQDGELKNNDDFKGLHVLRAMLKSGNSQSSDKGIYETENNTDGALDKLFKHLGEYYDVCHLNHISKPKTPCNIYEMLVWLTGLPHRQVQTSMRDVTILDVIDNINKVNKKESDISKKSDAEMDTDIVDGPTISLVEAEDTSLDAYPRKVSYENMRSVVTHICLTSHDILCTIAGHGDEFTMYAVDYSNNSMQFQYPASGQDCLDMFLDILRRLLPTLSFLKTQCGLKTEHHGWYDCEYGMNTAPAKWPCKEHSSEKATDQPNTQPKCQPTCQANSKVKCQPTSPLMSYLNDCLPGHLPHHLTKIGCKYECATCPSTSKKGMPCLTPLGFRGFSGSTKKGRDVCKVLTKFLDNVDISCLFTLIPKPPTTLPEHFGFALSFAQYINTNKPLYVRSDTFSYAFESAIAAQSVDLYKNPYELTKSIADAYGSDAVRHSQCESYHLRNLTINGICKQGEDRINCASYVSSLCNYSYEVIAYNHAHLYLSWAIYLPWTFWDLLNNLYNAFCSINCQDWGCRGCLRGDKCKKGGHGVVDEDKPNNKCQCLSIVDCKGVAPTLYQYGFVFGEASTLNDKNAPKKCSDFCSQLKNVLNSKYFEKLFEECDNFLWIIRQPFSYLVLTLWLLSLLYLLHIMVVRLDLLHIKSHLHSPSSHRIAAQSLLAAGRVNKLNRVFYLQP
ncbi:hypothetical protein, conserved [Babesia bigemina]|uniref:C3H1-type domain-containing protein n=1 Tax=Babesia bigemina TaxID=5866 RepID=A0A061BJU8_BABBI|nr:hypothetical protein, conserved [Babesia bigemina]CDR71737.1 hypothetical protein, conserved [Babesia bigemina]|eukprot:XP_012770682.1 hypothetical protein, conserved [Babesia bigemina]